MTRFLLIACTMTMSQAQESPTGFEVRSTISGGVFYSHRMSALPRDSGPLTAGVRSVFYPTLKLSQNWSVFGAIQTYSRPYFYDQFATQGYGLKTDVLQAHLSYSRFWKNNSLIFRAGQLSTAFGSFMLRYDDAVNPLIDMPSSYGYYRGLTTLGLMGAQVDFTAGKIDTRAQFVNSSPMNRRSIADKDQYGNWAGGAGYTIRQGIRIGVSAYRGPYTHRGYRFYFRGEPRPRDLPATGYGIDFQAGHGAWNFYGELHRFQNIYRVIPTFNQHAGYGEVRRVLHPRWYFATRIGYLRASAFPGYETYEIATGYRPNAHQLIKMGYQIQRGAAIRGTLGNTIAVQLVTVLKALSISRD